MVEKKSILDFLGLNKTINEIHIRKSVFDNIIEFSKTTYPREFLAFFEGDFKEGILMIEDLLFQPYIADRESAWPRLNFPTTSKVIGSVHSHPGGSNRPSRSDLGFFQKTGIVHGIINSPYSRDDFVLYDLHGDRLPFREVE